jgi:hypothetical protein
MILLTLTYLCRRFRVFERLNSLVLITKTPVMSKVYVIPSNAYPIKSRRDY